MASHLTLEEREIIAHDAPGRKNADADRRPARPQQEHDFPRAAAQSQPQRLLGGVLPSGRPSGVGVSGRGWPRCSGRKCGVMSARVCGSDGRPTRSPDARAATFPHDRRRQISPPTDLRLDSRGAGPRKALAALSAASGPEAAGVGKTRATADQREHRGAPGGRGSPQPLRRLGGGHDRGCQSPRRGRDAGGAEVGIPVAGQGPQFAGGDRPPGRRPTVRDHATRLCERP